MLFLLFLSEISWSEPIYIGFFNHFYRIIVKEKNKVEFLCNECCWFDCADRKICYENVSRKNLGENCPDHICTSPEAGDGYMFSKAMKNPGFISVDDIRNIYMPMGFSNFKIEGRTFDIFNLMEHYLYYMIKPECIGTARLAFLRNLWRNGVLSVNA